MKRFIFSIIALAIFSSCTYVTSYTGTITVLDNKGETVKKWENITFQHEVNGYTTTNAFKFFGINFYDPESKKHIILGNAVPYIIEYNYKTSMVDDYSSSDSPSTPTTNENRAKFLGERDNLINEYEKLEGFLSAYKEELPNLEKDSEEYTKMKSLIKTTKDKMSEINKTLWNQYHYSI